MGMGMKRLLVAAPFMFLAVGCQETEEQEGASFDDELEQSVVERCHGRIESAVRWDYEILSTEAHSIIPPIEVSGRVRLQNGFGAWERRDYYCEGQNVRFD